MQETRISLAINWSREHLGLALLLLSIALFVSKSLYNVPVSIMAVLGAGRAFRYRHALVKDRAGKYFLALFLCLWLPLVLSLPDAVNIEHSMRTALPYVRFLFAGFYLLLEVRKPVFMKKLMPGIYCLCTFWCVDALIQVVFSANLLGYPYEKNHITGMFYPRNTIAHVLAAFSPAMSFNNHSLRRYKHCVTDLGQHVFR